MFFIMSLWLCCVNECVYVSVGVFNVGVIIGVCDGVSVMIFYGESVIYDNVVLG